MLLLVGIFCEFLFTSEVLVVPEVAIGAIGKFQKLPRYDDKGNVVPTHVMCISWAADHRFERLHNPF